MSRRLLSLLRPVLHSVLNSVPDDPLERLLAQERERRLPMFRRALEYVDYELVSGDILEFGVYGGFSLAMFAAACRQRWDLELERRIVGFDSFEGLPTGKDQHPRWNPGDCATHRSWHPVIELGKPVSASAVVELFEACRLPQPVIEAGRFEDVLPMAIGSRYKQAAIVHVDCDLYEPTRFVLDSVEPILQNGTVMLFDDWFHYRADPTKGECRALAEFIRDHPHWIAVPYQAYSTYSQAFIMHRR